MKMCGTKVKSSLAEKLENVDDVAIDLESKTATVKVADGGSISGDLCKKALAKTSYQVTNIVAKP